MSNCAEGSFNKYPDEDWNPALQPPEGAKPRTEVTYRDERLELKPSTAPSLDDAECKTLISYMQERDLLKQQIYREARGGTEAVATVLASIGLSTDSPVNLDLKTIRAEVFAEIKPSIDDFKFMFSRARPWTCCGEKLPPMLPRDHLNYPGQPAYPSGHATVAWVFAYLFGSDDPSSQRAAVLENAAEQVARRREVAGLHYPSDSAGGKQLARQLVDIMLKKQSELPFVAKIQAIVKKLPP
jgi:hypothetical protein